MKTYQVTVLLLGVALVVSALYGRWREGRRLRAERALFLHRMAAERRRVVEQFGEMCYVVQLLDNVQVLELAAYDRNAREQRVLEGLLRAVRS